MPTKTFLAFVVAKTDEDAEKIANWLKKESVGATVIRTKEYALSIVLEFENMGLSMEWNSGFLDHFRLLIREITFHEVLESYVKQSQAEPVHTDKSESYRIIEL